MKKHYIPFIILATLSLLLLYWSISLYVAVNKEEPISEFIVSPLKGNKDALKEDEIIIKMPDISADGWFTYTNEEYGFLIDYPAAWGIWQRASKAGTSIIFGSAESKPGGGFWGIHIRQQKEDVEGQINGIIAETGRQFDDRKEERKELTIAGRDAQKIIVTTPSNKSWISEKIILRNDGLIFFIGNGAIKSDDFHTFYKSFRFLR